MNKTFSLRTIAALLLLVVFGGWVALASATQPGSGPMMGTPGAGMPVGTPGMGQMTEMTQFDLIFIDMMIMHHQGAVAMAEVALERGEHPELVQLAAEIITAQNDEIARLQDWRDAWYPGAPAMSIQEMMGGMLGMMPGMQDTMGMMPMTGMMDPVTMAESLRTTAEPFDLAFINAMIPHHLGALMMAEMAVQQSTHPELAALAQEMITAQEAEIVTMRGWRAEWFGQEATPAS